MAKGLSIDGEHFTVGQAIDVAHPANEAVLELCRVDASKDPAEGVMRGDAIWEGKKAAQPGIFCSGIILNINPAISVTNDGTDGNRQNVSERMQFRALNARVFKLPEVFDNR